MARHGGAIVVKPVKGKKGKVKAKARVKKK